MICFFVDFRDGIGRGVRGTADHFIVAAEDAVHGDFDALGVRTYWKK